MSDLPNKIEFGCGGRRLEGWLCTDILECDITKPLPYPDEHFEMAYVSHCVEHVTTHECFHFFREVFRILKPDGVFRIIVPTLDNISTREHAVDLILGHGHKILLSAESLMDLLWAAGFERGNMKMVDKDPVLDVHDQQIGVEKDAAESFRLEVVK